MPIRLNLASGQRPFEDWTNVDIRQQFKDGKPYKCDLISDVKKLEKVEDNSVDVIVAHHLLEHIQLNDILDTAKEWHRVLKVGGRLAIFVPNLRELAKGWLDGRIENFIFLVNTYGAYQGYVEDTHKWGFDKNELIDRMSGWDGKNRSLNWECRDIVREMLNTPLYQGAECALDWWILGIEFEKK